MQIVTSRQTIENERYNQRQARVAINLCGIPHNRWDGCESRSQEPNQALHAQTGAPVRLHRRQPPRSAAFPRPRFAGVQHTLSTADVTAGQMARSQAGLLASELQKFRLLPLVLTNIRTYVRCWPAPAPRRANG